MEEINTIEDAKSQIVDALEHDGGYTRNLLGCILRIVDKKFGTDAANHLIDEYDLESCGMNKE